VDRAITVVAIGAITIVISADMSDTDPARV
jgi:hypothetical protein